MNTSLTNQINVQDAKNNFSKLLARAHAGEEIVICMAGKPYARLVAVDQPAQRKLGLLSDAFSADELAALDKAIAEPLTDEELRLWYEAPILQPWAIADHENADEGEAP